jgi:thiamine pyrophosphate-dependent acetolactate synthase large subunit-like protein
LLERGRFHADDAGNLGHSSAIRRHQFVLFVVENGTYEITGNQPVPGTGFVDFVAMARAAGFQRTFSFDDPDDYQAQLPLALQCEGPVLIAVRVEPGLETPLSRNPREQARYLQVSLSESARRLRETLTAGK